MVSIDQAHTLLEEIAAELPAAFWDGLNGGVSLLPDTVRSPHDRTDSLFVLGEYRVEPLMGRYINLYYGSFRRLYPSYSAQQMKEALRKTLFHEFTHHVESLAGERGLEIKDARQIAAYRRKTTPPSSSR